MGARVGKMEKTLWRLDLSAPNEAYDLLAGLFALEATGGWEEIASANGTTFRAHAENRDFLENLRAEAEKLAPETQGRLKKVENPDWREAWKDFFTPIVCGNAFVVLPPWLADFSWPGRHKIVIEPASAFGTGHHATTRLCLAALDRVLASKSAPTDFLDLGCGSGVLGLAACASDLNGLGLDIDPLAIENAEKNRELNGAKNLILLWGDIRVVNGRTFDLVMANILANPLIEFAPEIRGALREGGKLILSGVLAGQTEKVAEAYRALGQPEILAEDEWRALVWK